MKSKLLTIFLILLIFTENVYAKTTGSIIGDLLVFVLVIAFAILITICINEFIYRKDDKEDSLIHPSDKQIITHASITWLIIPATLFIPWIDAKPSDNGGTAFGLVLIGFIAFLTSSFLVARKVFQHYANLSNGARIFGYSAFVLSSIILITFLISLID